MRSRIFAGFVLAVAVVFTQTARADDPKPVTKIAFGSCVDQDKPVPIFDTMAATKPDLLLLMGDNMYADLDKKLKVGDVYFLGLGPHIAEAPPSLIAALQNDPDIRRDKVTLRPLEKVLEVTGEAIRDRDTGAYGPAFRVDDIEAATRRLAANGVKMLSDEMDYISRRLRLFEGPEGITLELVQWVGAEAGEM